MPNLADFNDALPDIPEIRVLATIAGRHRIRFWLKTPTADLYLKFHSWYGKPVSLYDFVGPFETLTIALEKDEDGDLLNRSLGDSLPLAGFHAWNVVLYSSLAETSFANLPFDSLVLEFDGTAGKTPRVELGAINSDVNVVIHEYLNRLHPEPVPPHWTGPKFYPSVLLTALRVAHYWFRYSAPDSPVDPRLLDRTATRLHAESVQAGPLFAIDPLMISAIERLTLDVLFTALNFDAALLWLRNRGAAFVPAMVNSSAVLRKVLVENDILGAALVGGLLLDAPRRTDLLLRNSVEPGAGDPGSIIPWTPIGADTEWEDDCCRYRDFRIPPGVIVWRPRQGPAFPNVSAQEYAVAVRWEGEGASNYVVQAVPGILARDTALVARFDHGYARTIASKDARLEYGILAERTEA